MDTWEKEDTPASYQRPTTIKIMARRGPRYIEEQEFQRELRVLTRLTRMPPTSVARFSKLRDWFTEADGFCIVFDRFSATLASILLDQTMQSIPTHQIREISRQVIQATRFLHDNGIIHTDLNPSNIMFVNTARTKQRFYGLDNLFHDRNVLVSTEIRIIDFGSVNEDGAKCKGSTGTPGYQAPEIVMEWSWTQRIDHFAIGCIIAEMLTYQPLIPQFDGTTEETLTIMDKTIGPFPDPIKAEIEADFPNLPDSGSTNQDFIPETNADLTQDRIEDPDAARLVARLTHLDPSRRGTLKNHERSRFITTYEM
ncbi:kinase-like domain-containing protein [Mycena galericulata]|nr:kinase-like domain-containing protein [Mycena galericulata]